MITFLLSVESLISLKILYTTIGAFFATPLWQIESNPDLAWSLVVSAYLQVHTRVPHTKTISLTNNGRTPTILPIHAHNTTPLPTYNRRCIITPDVTSAAQRLSNMMARPFLLSPLPWRNNEFLDPSQNLADFPAGPAVSAGYRLRGQPIPRARTDQPAGHA
jgi:hypothetical protein